MNRCVVDSCEMNPQPDVDGTGADLHQCLQPAPPLLRKCITHTPLPIPKSSAAQNK